MIDMLFILLYLTVILASCFGMSFFITHVSYMFNYPIRDWRSFKTVYKIHEMKILRLTTLLFCLVVLLSMNVEFFGGIN